MKKEKIIVYLFLFFSLLISGCDDHKNHKIQYFSNSLIGGGRTELFCYDYFSQIPEDKINKGSVPEYYEVIYNDAGKITNVKRYIKPSSDVIIGNESTDDNLDKYLPIKSYVVTDYIKYSYDKKGRLNTVETDERKIILEYTDSIVAKYSKHNKTSNQIEENGIIKFTPTGNPFLVLFKDDSYPRSIEINYGNNRKIYEFNLGIDTYEKYEIEYIQGKITRIVFINRRGESFEQVDQDGFELHRLN